MEVAEVTIAGVSAVPLVLALVELAKRNLPYVNEYAEFVSLLFGVVIVVAAQGVSQESVMAGLVVGLAASGIWSGGKHTAKKFKK